MDWDNEDPAYWDGLRGHIPDKDWAEGIAGVQRGIERRIARQYPWDKRVGEDARQEEVQRRTDAIEQGRKSLESQRTAAAPVAQVAAPTPAPTPAPQPPPSAPEASSPESAPEFAEDGLPYRLPLDHADKLVESLRKRNMKTTNHIPGAWWILPDGTVAGNAHDLDRGRGSVVRHDHIAGKTYGENGLSVRWGSGKNGLVGSEIHGASDLAQLMHDTGAVRLNSTKDMARGGMALSMHGAPTDSQMRAIRGISSDVAGKPFVWEIKNPERHADETGSVSGGGLDNLEAAVRRSRPNPRAKALESRSIEKASRLQRIHATISRTQRGVQLYLSRAMGKKPKHGPMRR